MRVKPYVGGEASLDGQSGIAKLSSNESALGASPKAIAAFRAAADELHRYPDGASDQLRAALAEFHDLNASNIICGNGSDEIIGALTHAYAGPGDEIVYSAHGFLMYPIAAMAAGAEPVAAAESDHTASVDALLEKVGPKTKIVFLANPNNPTGTYLPADEVRRLHAGLPSDVLLVVDCAYAEFVTRNDYSPGIELVEANENVVMTRTFSKIYGLAALRLGWAYCSADVAGVFHRFRSPFNVNAAAQAAGVAALGDIAHTDAARLHNDQWLPWLAAQVADLGLSSIPSVGNFVSVKFADAASAEAAQAILHAHGVIPRAIAGYGLADYLRFTIGTEAENKKVVAALAAFVAQDRPGQGAGR